MANEVLELEGDIGFFESFTIETGGKVTVPAYQPGAHPGYVQIQANTITVKQGASISADAAGYPGVPGMNGLCFPMMSCAGVGVMVGDPGGGGGYFGKGANGTSEMTQGTCVDLAANAVGGASFAPMGLDAGVPLGSAGGASNYGTGAGMTIATAGGAGGGGIRLSAGTVVIDGTLSANGAASNAFNGVAPGGGSGGTIVILAGALSGTGTLSVLGGAGAAAMGISGVYTQNNGGGGSGGAIVLNLASGAAPSSFKLQLDGGQTGDCPTGNGGSAGGEVTNPLPNGATCVDLDGDGFTSPACGGKDCDDVDPSIHPGAPEICNGKDDDCDGKIDEAPNNCTAMGLICVDAGCVTPPSDAGTETGDAGLDHIDFTGGCQISDAAQGNGGAALAIGIAAMALAASRRRRAT
jgi:hypothetical protein